MHKNNLNAYYTHDCILKKFREMLLTTLEHNQHDVIDVIWRLPVWNVKIRRYLWNCQIIFRCASIHGRAGFILFTIIKTILSTFFFTVSNFYKNLVKWVSSDKFPGGPVVFVNSSDHRRLCLIILTFWLLCLIILTLWRMCLIILSLWR
jgi:hypothetical protein